MTDQKTLLAWHEAGALYRRMEESAARIRVVRRLERRTEIDAWKPRLLEFSVRNAGISRWEIDFNLLRDLPAGPTCQDAHDAFDELVESRALRPGSMTE